MTNASTSYAGQRPERFPPGLFKQGEFVRLKRPGAHAGAFDNPRALLQVLSVNYFRMYEPPTYTLGEPESIGVTPFRDADLRRGRQPARAS
jgi:hypothetical protein